MAVLKTVFAGQVGVMPGLARLSAPTNTLAEITSANYLNTIGSVGGSLNPGDFVFAQCEDQDAVLVVVLSGGNLVLELYTPKYSGTLNNFAVFIDSEGTIGNGTTTAIHNAPIQTGSSGTAGGIIIYPSTTAKGRLIIQAVNNSADHDIVIKNAFMAQDTDITIPDPGLVAAQMALSVGSLIDFNLPAYSGTDGILQDSGVAANKVLTSSFNNPSVNVNLVSFNVNFTVAQLNAGPVTLLTAASVSAQYRIVQLYMCASPTPFGGIGSDKDLYIGDTFGIQFSRIPAVAGMQAWPNAVWGSTALPFPTGVNLQQATSVGANLIAEYQGGTTNYTSGNVILRGLLERIA